MKKTGHRTKSVIGKETTTSQVGVPDLPAAPDTNNNLSLLEIKELIELIAEKQFSEFELERGSFRLRLLKSLGREQVSQVGVESAGSGERVLTTATTQNSVQASPPISSVAVTSDSVPQDEGLHVVSSPIVGTFYSSPSPTADPFVKIGDVVDTGKVLCIIEAMKLMNEIQSDASGTVVKIYVENGQPVEYGQALFGIKK